MFSMKLVQYIDNFVSTEDIVFLVLYNGQGVGFAPLCFQLFMGCLRGEKKSN